MIRVEPSALRRAIATARERGIDRDAYRLLLWAHDVLGDGLMMTTAFGKSGMVLLHMVKDLIPQLPVYFLDTGFHFKETLEFLEHIRETWKVNLIRKRPKLFGPAIAKKHGARFYETNPDLCCHLNKTEPLAELFGESGEYQGWITGIRRDQASTRANADSVELLEGNLIKVQPLAFWGRDEVEAYVRRHSIPLHPLLGRGYSSIGCEPCTSPCFDPSNERAGRWAGKKKTECGIHLHWKKAEKPAGQAGGRSDLVARREVS